ncbi:hypothetical protein E1263_07305 [Kribbella antibiotica]|uniref:Uncharacterized protein n=1 Tax=Kribbella antibiotica TaxID=190195 RepID=A0A4R4ZSX5_9ACTN|nr:hypothetical protein E1263_07305 [Kribbella antibiotica]
MNYGTRKAAMRYQVTHSPAATADSEPTVTDAAGVTEIVRRAALTGTRVHIRPVVPAGPEAESET